MMVNLQKKILQIECPAFQANPESIDRFLDIIEIIKNNNLSANGLIVLDKLSQMF